MDNHLVGKRAREMEDSVRQSRACRSSRNLQTRRRTSAGIPSSSATDLIEVLRIAWSMISFVMRVERAAQITGSSGGRLKAVSSSAGSVARTRSLEITANMEVSSIALSA